METSKRTAKGGIISKMQWTAGIIFAFAVIAVALISSFEIAMYSDFDFYEKEYEKYDVLSELDMTMEDTMYVTREMMSYLRGDREELSVITTVEGREQDFFNGQDRFHMGEVKELFIGGLNIRAGACAAGVLCLIFLLVTGADIKSLLPKSYWIAVGISAGTAAVIGIASLVDFNAVFVRFHHIFFDNDLWIFDPAEDYMIRMLPEGLFYDFVMRIGGFFLVMLAALFLLSILPAAVSKIRKKQYD